MAYRKGVIIKWQNRETEKEKCNPFITNVERKQITFSRNYSKFSNKKGTPPPSHWRGLRGRGGWTMLNIGLCYALRPCYKHSEQMYYSMVRPKTQVKGRVIFAPVFKEDYAL